MLLNIKAAETQEAQFVPLAAESQEAQFVPLVAHQTVHCLTKIQSTIIKYFDKNPGKFFL